MNISIDEVYRTIQFIVRKNSSGGAINPDQFNLIINRAQFTKFMRAYGNPQEYQPGKPIPRISFEVTQSITDELSIFIKNIDQILDNNGRFNYPDDYVHTIPGMYLISAVNNADGKTFNKKIVPIEDVDKAFESYRLSSGIVSPTTSEPICIQDSQYIQIYPVMNGVVKYSYLRTPVPAIWGFDLVNGRPVYSPSKSVDLEWLPMDINSIIVLAVSYIGISIKSPEVSQYSDAKEAQGV